MAFICRISKKKEYNTRHTPNNLLLIRAYNTIVVQVCSEWSPFSTEKSLSDAEIRLTVQSVSYENRGTNMVHIPTKQG